MNILFNLTESDHHSVFICLSKIKIVGLLFKRRWMLIKIVSVSQHVLSKHLSYMMLSLGDRAHKSDLTIWLETTLVFKLSRTAQQFKTRNSIFSSF